MKIMSRLFALSMLLIFLSGCTLNSDAVDVDVFQYKNSYVGDNSAVGNTLMHLHGAEHYNGFQLHTTEEPYGITANYDWSESELNQKETAVNNASYLFALIQNADWVTFHFDAVEGAEEYTITREDLQSEYDVELQAIETEDELKEHIKELLEDDAKVNELLAKSSGKE